jgi:hypothetical protein
VLYFFVAGLSYMCVEIGLIAKAELFLGNPLYAVAVILALFLASNGLGAYLQDRLRVFRGPATLRAADRGGHCVGRPRHAPVQRAPALAAPAAQDPLRRAVRGARRNVPRDVLPARRERVVDAGHRAAVPATYAMATLSSVWGASWAMTAITNLGFSAVILMGAAGYT